MGGSGGGFFNSSVKPKKLFSLIRDEEKKAEDQQFSINVNHIIQSVLTTVNTRDHEVITNHLNTITSALNKDIEGAINTMFGGSVSKHTYVDGLSDIDTLVLLNGTELEGMTPAQVKQYFFDILVQRLPRTQIIQGTLAVTVKFSDIDIQLLPAVKHGDGYKIPDSKGEQWSYIKPTEFTSKLTSVNKDCNGKVVPTIKLAKSIMTKLPETSKLSGYHVEALAIDIFENYQGAHTPKVMIEHFFSCAAKKVLSPIKDKTGQSRHIDDYLGEKNSLERKVVSANLDRIARRMQNANGACSTDIWRDIVEG